MALPFQKKDADLQPNAEGHPEGLKGTAESVSGHNFTNINAGTAPGTPQHANVDNRRYHNDLVPWFVVLAVCVLIVGMVAAAGLAVALTDRDYRARETQLLLDKQRAELRAEYESRVARAEALAELARKEASTAKDTVDLERQKSKAREELKNVR